MADNIVGNLFGVNPALMQQQQQATATNNAFKFANLSPSEQSQYSAFLGGNQLAQGLGSMLGGQDPMMQKASMAKQLASQFDVTTADGLRQYAQALAQNGAPDLAQLAAVEADKRQNATLQQTKTTSEIAKNLRDKTIPTSGLGKLLYEKQQLLNQGIAPNDPQVVAYNRAILAEGEGKGTKIVMPAGETEIAKVIGKGIGEKQLSIAASGEAASENLNKINETLNELQTSNAFTGSFAELQSNIAKAQAKFADDKKAGKRVTDTEYLDALLGSDVFPMISSLGIGARGLDTPAEREFLRKVMTGTINLERGTLIKLTKTRKDIAERAIKKYNDKVDSGELNTYFKLKGTAPTKIDIPKEPIVKETGAAPSGIDPAVWNAMTPQEKALWN